MDDCLNPISQKSAGFCVTADKSEKCRSGAKSKMKLQAKLLVIYALSALFIMLALGGVFYSRLWTDRR
jgi:hypothetical protein